MTLAQFRQSRTTQKRAQILAAALALFRAQGFGQTAMEAVAREAQVSTATLYRHFRSKEALFEAAASASLDRLEAALPASEGAPPARLAALAEAYANLLCEPDIRSLMRMLVAETGRNRELAIRFQSAIKARISDLFAGHITDGIARGAFRTCEDAAFAAGQLQGMIEHGTLLAGLVSGDEAAPLLAPSVIAAQAFETWSARWLLRQG
jgi:AcrR family transcriptional regulator